MTHGHLMLSCARTALRGSAVLLLAIACGKSVPVPEEEHTELPMGDGRVTLTAAAARAADVRTALVEAGIVDAEGSLVAPGSVELDPRRVEVISARVDGRLERLTAVAGDAVAVHDVVARVFSVDFLNAQEDLLLAERRATELAATPDSTGAQRLARGAARRLTLMGALEEDLATLRRTQEPLAHLPIRAPIAGTILESHVLAGSAVAVGAPIFTVADLTELDVVAEVPEASLPTVRVGQRATIEVPAYPNLRFTGAVERLHDVLNPVTRTARAVLHVQNPSRTLRPGMYASVRFSVSGARAADRGVIIASSAVVTDGEARVVFVQVDSNTFERREVRIESLAPAGSMRAVGERVRVTEGLSVGERVVIRGAFTLKSELSKAALGDSH